MTPTEINRKIKNALQFGQRIFNVDTKQRWCVVSASYDKKTEIWHYDLILENSRTFASRTSLEIENAIKRGKIKYD